MNGNGSMTIPAPNPVNGVWTPAVKKTLGLTGELRLYAADGPELFRAVEIGCAYLDEIDAGTMRCDVLVTYGERLWSLSNIRAAARWLDDSPEVVTAIIVGEMNGTLNKGYGVRL